MEKEPISLDWLEGRSWDDLLPYEQELIVDSQTEHLEEDEYIPNSAVSNLINLLHLHGVVNAADIDIDVIRYQLGLEHISNPKKIELAITRIKQRQCHQSEGCESKDEAGIMLEDIISELRDMAQEEKRRQQVEDDINFLKIVGIDPRQLANMDAEGREGQDILCSLANDLRSPIAMDIAQYYIRKNARYRLNNKRQVFRSVEDLLVSVEARKLREARQKSQILDGDDRAIRRLVTMFGEMKKSAGGREELLKIQSRAMESAEGLELMHAVFETEQLILKESQTEQGTEVFFDPGDLNWR